VIMGEFEIAKAMIDDVRRAFPGRNDPAAPAAGASG
jgi:hypothetical protein